MVEGAVMTVYARVEDFWREWFGGEAFHELDNLIL
jgi:hypothetical protein